MKPVRSVAVLTLLIAFAAPAFACPWCRAEVRREVYADDFYANTSLLLLPLAVLTLIGVGVYFGDRIGPLLRRRIK